MIDSYILASVSESPGVEVFAARFVGCCSLTVSTMVLEGFVGVVEVGSQAKTDNMQEVRYSAVGIRWRPLFA